MAERRLTWWPEIGVGWYPVTSGIEPYNHAYFERFAQQADTDIGRALMRARCDFVERHFDGALIDVGIGSGAFIEARIARRKMTYGYDVNPAGIQWLEQRQLFVDPYLVPFDAMTLWDVIEHIADFRPLLKNVRRWLFISTPIFRGPKHAMKSKHFRTDEHYWYFTRPGLIHVMGMIGFDLVEASKFETSIGREDIGSFAFRRRD